MGRPPAGSVPRNNVVCFRVDDRELDMVLEMADRLGTSVSQVAQQAMVCFCQKERRGHDVSATR